MGVGVDGRFPSESEQHRASSKDGLRRDCQHLVALLCDEHDVFELRRPPAVDRLDCPRVRPQRRSFRSLREDGLYREGHPGHEL